MDVPTTHWRTDNTALDRIARFLSVLRAGLVLIASVFLFAALTAPLIIARKLKLRAADHIPVIFSRVMIWLLRVRLHVTGHPFGQSPLLITSNHTMWLDIFVLNSRMKMHFIAKTEMSRWPVVGFVLRYAGIVFVDRERRTTLQESVSEIRSYLDGGNPVVLFPEGTTSDGRNVRPFFSSLFGIASGGAGKPDYRGLSAQACAIVYTHQSGMPIRLTERNRFAYVGDVSLFYNLWNVVRNGPIDVTLALGPPLALTPETNRKKLCNDLENQVRDMVGGVLYP